MVEKMPRSIGIRCGVKTTDTGPPATSDSTCSISGVCRWLPTAYADTLSLHSGKWAVSFGVRPAPDTPDLLSMMMPVGSTRPRATSPSCRERWWA